ncbi:MBL fold metallo-hydrolase [Aquabacterium sp. A3]|uniref:MBL fold metallo-hydrolase n=1 Tax=Aquabacterium sp. A3 TaxID=3132829 RepID=UPI003119CF30
MRHARMVAGTGRRHSRMGEPVAFAEGLYEVAPDTYAWMVPNGSWGETNLGLVRCGDQSVLIDTCWDLHHMREVLSHAQSVLNEAPITRVINTHADGDHCWGNQLFAGLPITATQAAVAQMHHHPPRQLRALQRSARWFEAIPLAGVNHLGRYMGDMLRPYRFDGVQVLPASQPFSGETTVSVQGSTLHLMEVGPGHTDGDCIVHLPQRGVVYAGDILFVGVTPVAWAGPVSSIVRALQRVLDLQPEVIVPGHGPLADAEDVRAQIDYWEWLQVSLRPLADKGLLVKEACESLVRSSAFKRAPFARWRAQERVFTSACTLYREWRLPLDAWPGALGALNHFRQQALVQQLLWQQAQG